MGLSNLSRSRLIQPPNQIHLRKMQNREGLMAEGAYDAFRVNWFRASREEYKKFLPEM